MLKIQNNSPLLSDKEIEQLFFNYDLHQKKSYYVINKEHKGYETDRPIKNFMDDARYLKEKYESGHTIVIKNMEHFNASIQEAAKELGEGTDVHLYLAPEGGDSFGWHTDDRKVWIKMERGSKIFATESWANETKMIQYIKLHQGNCLVIHKGQRHVADPIGPSVLLSFGVADSIPVNV